MLGFSSIAETPFAQATTSAAALGFLAAAASLSTAQPLLFEGLAFHTSASVSASTAVSILFDAQAAIAVTDAIASISINDVVSFGPANVTPSAATVAFSTNALDYEALANIITIGAASTGVVDNLSDVDAQANVTTAEVSSTIVAYAFSDVDAQASVVPAQVTLTSSVIDFSDVDAQANIAFPEADALAIIQNIDFTAEARITPPDEATAALLILEAGEIHLEFDAQANAFPLSVFADGIINPEDPTAIMFDYQQFADQYSRQRTLYIVTYEGSATVHIAEEDQTVYINNQQGSNTVYIAA